MLTFAIFPFLLFFAGAYLVLCLPLASMWSIRKQNRGRHGIICPETRNPADIELDGRYAMQTAAHNYEHSRIASCSRWPEKDECDQECLAQVNPSPENIERLLSKWCSGKVCGLCDRALRASDWAFSRIGWLDENRKLIELHDIELKNLQQELQDKRPLCWTCHLQERERQAKPPAPRKGDRHRDAALA